MAHYAETPPQSHWTAHYPEKWPLLWSFVLRNCIFFSNLNIFALGLLFFAEDILIRVKRCWFSTTDRAGCPWTDSYRDGVFSVRRLFVFRITGCLTNGLWVKCKTFCTLEVSTTAWHPLNVQWFKDLLRIIYLYYLYFTISYVIMQNKEKATEAEKGRGFFFSYALLSRDNDLLSGHLYITKVVFFGDRLQLQSATEAVRGSACGLKSRWTLY